MQELPGLIPNWDKNGTVLPDTATQASWWIMTRDNVTGLIWEIKTDDGSIHDKDNWYTWYDSDPATNGGDPGTPGVGTDTEDFIDALNGTDFGGYSDWRMPTVKEVSSLVNSGTHSPAIDTTWFPHTTTAHDSARKTTRKGTMRLAVKDGWILSSECGFSLWQIRCLNDKKWGQGNNAVCCYLQPH